MPSGIQTFDAAGATMMYSPTMTGIFYNNSGVYSGTSNLPVTGFRVVQAICTPVQTPSYYWNGTSGVYSAAISATGQAGWVSGVGQTQYLGPTTIENGSNCYVVTPSLSNIDTQIYTFGTPVDPPSPGSYGMQAPGAQVTYPGYPAPIQAWSIDQRYKAYYVQPGPNGQNLRTATCTSIPSSYGTSRSSYTVPDGTLTGQVIYFEKAFQNPPLVFVTETTGLISFHYMHRNGAGLYDGMVVVAASSASTQGLAGTSFYTPNTYSFTYFLISDEVPLYKAQAPFGIQVFNGLGTKVFDSSYFCSTFTSSYAGYQPYFYLRSQFVQPSCSNSGSGSYITANITRYLVGATQGFCINNINSIKGHTTYTSLELGSGSSSSGPTTFWGHYVSIAYDPLYASKVATVQAYGTNGVYMNPTFQTAGIGNSWEYYDHTKPIIYLFANYSY